MRNTHIRGVMKRIVLLVVLAVVLCLIVPASVGAIEDPVAVSTSLLYLDFPEGGTAVVNITVTNTSDTSLIVDIANWYAYTYPSEGSQWIDPSWVTAIEPSSQLLIPGGQMVANVQYSLPDDAAELRYETWIKVAVGGWEKPITVVIRKGAAIPKYEYSVSPSYYRLLVYGPDASIVVDDASDKAAPPITVKSKCSATTLFYASAESPDEDIVISADSQIKHTDEEVGTVYSKVSNDTAQEWYSTPYTPERPLSVGPFSKGLLTWSLSIPDNVRNGHYALAVRISPAESTGGIMTTNYLIWMLVKVDRAEANAFDYHIILWGCLGALAVFGVVYGVAYSIIIRRRKVVAK